MGRALVTKKYKYVLYHWGKNREQFFDLEKDPYEINNLIDSKAYLKNIDACRKKLLDWCKETKDTKFMKNLVLPSNSDLSSSDLFDKPF